MNYFFSALLWLIYGLSFIPSLIIAAIVRLFTFPFDPHNRYPNAVMMFFGKSIFILNPFWKRHYFGLEKLKEEKPACIRVANHQSFLDMPYIATLPTNMKWVSKKELFKLPIVGWLMSVAGHISVDRGAKGAAKSLLKMNKPINDGMCVMMFPEGTRSREGKLKAFKKGAFYAAMDNGYRIQPMVVEGTYQCIRPDTWVMNLSGNLYISVLDPVDPAGFDDVDSLKEHVHGLILKESERLMEIAGDKR